MPTDNVSRLRRLAPWLAALAAILVYANALHNGFALDDQAIVQQNPTVHQFAPFGDLWVSAYWPRLPFQMGLYRPLTIVSYMVEWTLWHGSPIGFHAVNIGVHALVTALVVILVLRLGAPPVAALLGGLLFAVHPVHVEAVANVVGYAELMMTLLVLLACLAHLSRRGPRAVRWVLIGACFLAALLVKESAVALPLLLVIVDYLDPGRRQPLWRTVWDDAPLYLLLAVLFAGYLGLRYAVLGVVAGTTPSAALVGQSSAVRVATALRTWLDYIRLMIWPHDLVAEYGPNVRTAASWRDLAVYLGLAAGGAILASAVWARRRAPWWTATVAWFAASVFVVSNLVVGVGIILAERTLYLPSVGLALAVVPLVALGSRHARVAWAVAAVAGGLAVARTWTRTPVWKSTTTVLVQLASSHPESFMAQSFMGDSAMRAGNAPEAVRHYAIAYGLVRDRALGSRYAQALVAVKDWPEAERVARASCRSGTPMPCLNIVDALLGAGEPVEARAVLDSISRFVVPSRALEERRAAVARALAGRGRVRDAPPDRVRMQKR
ncbi:MAG TPA: hypothetical protein VFK16_00410 [Gemmatimonadaceae bacterium]|nr:hypothetical protein [Gemmatimonadaceae bacterium]